MRNLPYLTLALIFLACISYLFLPNSQLVYEYLLRIGLIGALLTHPLLHNSIRHLYSNILGLSIVGTLIESWMLLLETKIRYAILLCAYVVSIVATGLYYARTGNFPVGMSGLIFAALPFTIFHYQSVLYRVWADWLDRLAPIGIGFVLSSLIVPLMPNISESGAIEYDVSNAFHLYAFFPSVLIAYFLFRRVRSSKSRSAYSRQSYATKSAKHTLELKHLNQTRTPRSLQ